MLASYPMKMPRLASRARDASGGRSDDCILDLVDIDQTLELAAKTMHMVSSISAQSRAFIRFRKSEGGMGQARNAWMILCDAELCDYMGHD